MLDYYDKVRSLSEKDLIKEIETLTKRVIASVPGTQTYDQLVNLYHIANEAYNELLMTSSMGEIKDEVIDIGEMEESVYTPDYTRAELLDAVVDQYVSKPKKRQ